MQKTLLYKVLAIGGVVLLLLIPLSIVNGVISERETFRDQVVRDVAKSSTGMQKIIGAILVIPYQQKVIKNTIVHKGGEKHTVAKEVLQQKYHYLLPEVLDVNGQLSPQELYRGIYKVPTYLANIHLKGKFSIPRDLSLAIASSQVVLQKPYLALGIKDVRGIHRSVDITVNGETLNVAPGSQVSFLEQGIHAKLPVGYLKQKHFEFSIDFDLQGMERLLFSPVGRFSQVSIDSPWPHPSFVGSFLPKQRDISQQGFNAKWETSFFATNMNEYLNKCISKQQCQALLTSGLGVSLHQGVDVYLQSERSAKYALLFIGLTFVAFFLFEILKGLPIHPIQYALVGVSLALFYFLLVSLSEHIAFSIAYGIAAICCVGLLGFYISFVLRSFIKSLMFSGAVVGLYVALYLLIQSVDYALLLGSVLLFCVLAAVMVITRRVDWYRIESSAKDHYLKDIAQT